MTLQTLLDRFDLLMDTPESVPKLRQFVLRLAMRGHLTERDPSDTPASVLLEGIQQEKQRLYNAGEIRKPKTFGSVPEEEIPFGIPSEWGWAYLGKIGRWGAGSTPKRSNPDYWDGGSIPWLKIGDLNNAHVQEAEEKVTEQALNECTFKLNQPGDVAIGMYGSIGKLGILEIKCVTNQAICVCTLMGGIPSRYLFYYLRTARETFEDLGAGGAQQNISKTKIVNTPLPLPPIEEQQRIVETVDGLMDECDALQHQQEREHALQVQVGTSATEALQSAEDAETLRPAWGRVRGHFDTVTATPEGVDALRQTILQLAVQGRLTERNPDDVPAEVILKKLGSDVADESTRSHLPSLPEGWRWAALKNLLSNLRNGYSKAPRAESGTPVLRISAVRPLSVDLDDVRFLQERPDDFEKYLARPGDLLFIRYNGNKGLVGACAVVPSSVDKIGHPDKLIRGEVQRPDLTVPRYIAIALNCGKSRQHIDKKSKTTAGNYGISQTDLRSTPVPVPPAEEQARMVGVVNQLLPFCDDLESLLPEAQKCSGQLLETALNDVGLDRRDTVPSQAAA